MLCGEHAEQQTDKRCREQQERHADRRRRDEVQRAVQNDAEYISVMKTALIFALKLRLSVVTWLT